MNKSKFLKKSLAMVLAVMLVVAMIPLGASAAATPPVISRIVVGYGAGSTSEAEVSGNTFTAKFPATENEFSMAVIMKEANGTPYYVDANNEDANFTNDQDDHGIWYSPALYADKFDNNTITIHTVDTDGNDGPTYTLKLERVSKDPVNTVDSFTVSGQYNDTVIDHIKGEISLVVPYGTTASNLNPVNAKVKLSSNKAKVQLPLGTDIPKNNDGTFTVPFEALNDRVDMHVVAESGAVKTYEVTIKTAEGFSEFSVNGQAKSATIEEDADGNKAPHKIFVNMPYGTKADDKGRWKITPNFKTTYASAEVKVMKAGSTAEADEVDIESGKEIDVKSYIDGGLSANENMDGKTMKLRIKYTNKRYEDWTVNFVVPQKNPAAELTALRIGNYIGVLEGNTFTVKVPGIVGSYPTVAGGTPAITVEGSKNAEVMVVVSGDSIDLGAAGTATFTDPVDCTSPITLRVFSEEDDPQKITDYKLVVKSEEPTPSQITGMTFQDPDENNYKAEISQSANTITFAVPYSKRTPADIQTWKLFYQISNGADINLDHTGAKVSEHTVKNANFLPALFNNKDKGDYITVSTYDMEGNRLSTKSYQIIIKRLPAETGRNMTNLVVASTNVQDDLNDSNQYGVKTSTTSVTVPVPYKDYEAIGSNDVYLIPTLPQGAKAYLVDGNAAALIKAPTADANGAPGLKLAKCTGADPKTDYVSILVVNEKGNLDIVDADGITDVDDFKAEKIGNYTEYKLIIKRNDPRKTATIKTASLYEVEKKQEVKGSVGTETLTFNVPFGMINTNLYMPYQVTGGETFKYVTENTAAGGAEVDYKTDSKGNVKVATSTAFTVVEEAPAGSGKYVLQDPNGDTVTSFVAYCEDPTLENKTVYTPVIKVQAAKLGAELTSFSLLGNAGVIDQVKHTVKVNVPYGSEVTHLVPTFTVSEGATAKCGRTLVSGDADSALNFSNPVKITVVSESGKNTNTYTVTVTPGSQFTDIDKDDWFYIEVMEAASRGWIKGVGDGKFNPSGIMKRGDFAQIIARVMGADESAYPESTFPDVSSEKYYSSAIAFCADMGYIDGDEKGYFNPEEPITREQMAKIICKAKGLDEVTATPSKSYKDDAKIAKWAKGFVYACTEAGIFKGDEKNNFNPKVNAKRCEGAAVLVRTFA